MAVIRGEVRAKFLFGVAPFSCILLCNDKIIIDWFVLTSLLDVSGPVLDIKFRLEKKHRINTTSSVVKSSTFCCVSVKDISSFVCSR